jgi:hypothetical protein
MNVLFANRSSMRRIWVAWCARLAGCLLLGAVLTCADIGMYAVNTVLHGGPTPWITMKGNDPRLPVPIQWALASQPPAAISGPFAWQQIEPGLDIAELPVIANGARVDSIMLTRIDTSRFRFAFRSAPSGDHDLAGWMHSAKPVVLINGSYFSPDGQPDTPFMSEGKLISKRNDPPAEGAFWPGLVGARWRHCRPATGRCHSGVLRTPWRLTLC